MTVQPDLRAHAEKAQSTAEFCITLGHADMDGISAENLANDLLDLSTRTLALLDRLSAALGEQQETR